MIDVEEVKKLANLARLDVPEAELASVAHDLESIIGFVDEIQNVDVGTQSEKKAMRVNVFREDIIAPIVVIQNLVDIAPAHQDGFVKVPKVLGE